MTTHLIRLTDGIIDKDGRQYRLVPVEPTSAMLVDAVKERHGQATYRCVSASGCVTFEQEARADYEAMLSAATVDLAGLAVKDCTLSVDEMRDVYAVIQSCIHDAETSDEEEKLERLLERAEEEIFRADRLRIDALGMK